MFVEVRAPGFEGVLLVLSTCLLGDFLGLDALEEQAGGGCAEEEGTGAAELDHVAFPAPVVVGIPGVVEAVAEAEEGVDGLGLEGGTGFDDLAAGPACLFHDPASPFALPAGLGAKLGTLRQASEFGGLVAPVEVPAGMGIGGGGGPVPVSGGSFSVSVEIQAVFDIAE